ncbi:IS66 family insertion sequence element accessory protein TnpA [Robinsoniella peoriensis]|uniref:IS66 family insertion sequence element accessory protein TnpA n=1 Tax=Robinsoniella peoriensis TaxID=180332 RepID=UPI003633ABA9
MELKYLMDHPQNLSASDRRWFDLIQQCRTSGKSDAQWMQEHEIKSPTFYYHVKQLRKKACDIPENSFTRQRNDIQEVVPMFMEEVPAVSSHEPEQLSSTDNTSAVRLNIQGITVEIANNATQEVIKNTIAVLRFLC